MTNGATTASTGNGDTGSAHQGDGAEEATGVQLAPASDTGPVDLVLPAEELLRLVYGRLDLDRTSAELPGHEVVPDLLQVFPGF